MRRVMDGSDGVMDRAILKNMSSYLKRSLHWTEYPVEYIFLVLIVFSLPVAEAPKNIAWVLYFLAWLINRGPTRRSGRTWDAWDTLFLLWIVSAAVVAAFAPFPDRSWRGAWDVLRFVGLGWALKRSHYTREELGPLPSILLVATVLALGYGLILLYGTDAQTLEIEGVGHVNHSAIFLAMVFGLALSMLLAQVWARQRSTGRIALCLAATVFIGAGIVIASSRAALGAAVLVTLLLGLAWTRRTWHPLGLLLLLILVFGAVTLATDTYVVRKIKKMSTGTASAMGYRGQLANTSLAAWRKYPLFGVGLRNYPLITEERVKQWEHEAGRTYAPKQYYFSTHGHSLFLNTLAERGLVGLAVVALVLAAWAWGLIRGFPDRQDDFMYWMLWGGSLSGWAVTTGAGIFNTTLHTTHGLLSLLLLGLWLGMERKPQRPPATRPV